MNSWINYHHLYYFKTIAEEGSVTKAAEKLRLGQSTLSAQLMQFESQLGVQLFERENKRLKLSEQGKVALEYSQQIFKMGFEMVEVLQDRIRPSRVHLQIGALDSIPKTVILKLTEAALKVEPCQVTIVEGGPNEMIRELQAHRVDLYVSNFLPSGSQAKGLTHQLISKKGVSVYGAKKFKNLKKNFPQSLKDQIFVMPTYDSQLRYEIEQWLRLQNLSVDIVAESQDTSLKKMMAVSGVGLICSTAHAVEEFVENGTLVQIGELSGVTEELHLIMANRKMNNPIAIKLLKSFSL